MTIRTRLTLLYAGVLLLSIALMGGILYYELIVERASVRAAGQATEPVTHEIAEIILFYGISTGVITIAAGWWLLRRVLAPLKDLAFAAERLQIHNLHEPLPRNHNGDEVDRLAEVLNATNVRLERSINQVRDFTLHASHELKTPLAILHAEIETSLHSLDTTDDQKETYASQLDEIRRLSKIVESLTLLAKADAGRTVLASDPVRLHELVHDSYTDTRILAQQKRITVVMVECNEATVRGDRHRLRQLLLNLTDNAVKYNEDGGRVDIELRCKDGLAELIISNTGPGIPAPMLERVFERFFRGDASHNSEIEGSGLGLSIAEWIVKAHGGKISIACNSDRLTTVKVSLPLDEV